MINQMSFIAFVHLGVCVCACVCVNTAALQIDIICESMKCCRCAPGSLIREGK